MSIYTKRTKLGSIELFFGDESFSKKIIWTVTEVVGMYLFKSLADAMYNVPIPHNYSFNEGETVYANSYRNPIEMVVRSAGGEVYGEGPNNLYNLAVCPTRKCWTLTSAVSKAVARKSGVGV